MSNFMKIRPVGAELFRADGRTDRQTDINNEANCRFSKFCERGKKSLIFHIILYGFETWQLILLREGHRFQSMTNKMQSYAVFYFCKLLYMFWMRNTSLMQSISIYFTYVQSLHVSGNTLPIIRRSIKCTNQHMESDRKTVEMIPEENREICMRGNNSRV